MKYVKFTDKDPRKGQVARLDDAQAQKLIDAGNATEVSEDEANEAGGAKAGNTVSGTSDRQDPSKSGTTSGSTSTAGTAPAPGQAPAPTSSPAPAPATGGAGTQR